MIRVRRSNRMSPSLILVASIAVATLRAAGGEVQPDELKFGTVRLGGTVEGSVRIFRDSPDADGLTLRLEQPPFVRIKEMALGSHTYGAVNRGFLDLVIELDTAHAGEHAGAILVTVGGQKVKVPVAATVRPAADGGTRVLVAETPFQRFSTNDARIFTTWLNLVKEADLDVDYLNVDRGTPVLRELDLDGFDVVLLGQDGVFWLRDRDVARLRRFVERGGRVVVTADAFFRGTVAKANELLGPAGLAMKDVESQESREVNLGPGAITEHPLTAGVPALAFFRPSPVEVTDREKGTILAAAPPFPGSGFVALGRSGEGEVVALGQSLWWSWLDRDPLQGSANAVLLRNLLRKPRAAR